MDELEKLIYDAFGTDEKAAFEFGVLFARLIQSSPRVRALVERIVAGGDEAAEDVCRSLLHNAAVGVTNPHVAARLRRLAGAE